MMDYIRTYSGLAFPTEPDPRFVNIIDIAHGLAMTCRWGGHSKMRYSVAAHSIHVSRMVPKEFQLQALLHDGSEAYFCDIPAPFKALLPDYKKIETKLMTAIAHAFDFTMPLDKSVKDADAAVLYLERKALFTHPVKNDVIRAVPAIKVDWNFNRWAAMSPPKLEQEFIEHFKLYIN
jgi:uncharacterized protein